MITSFDDFCIHQTTAPVCEPASSDRNCYDRYWMNGIDIGGGFMFEAGFAIYPNRHIQDAHFSVVVNGVQHSFHGSRRAPKDRAQSFVGPFRIEILKPLRSYRITLAPNSTGIECNLTFIARTAAVEEPQSVMRDDGRLIMNTSRFTQLGCWQGHIVVHGRRIEVNAATTRGARDKSWGIRPVGERESGAPGLMNGAPSVYWIWSPIDFGDICTQFNTYQDPAGQTTQLQACILPAYDDISRIPEGEEPGIREMHTASHRINWQPGTRRSRGAQLQFVEAGGETHEITLEPVVDFYMLGVGYNHPEWGHGMWKGEDVVSGETWELAQVNPLDPRFIHIHQLVRATFGQRQGYGTLETIVFGCHEPSGFKSLFDGAPES